MSDLLNTALRNLPAFIKRYIPDGPDRTAAIGCVEVIAETINDAQRLALIESHRLSVVPATGHDDGPAWLIYVTSTHGAREVVFYDGPELEVALDMAHIALATEKDPR